MRYFSQRLLQFVIVFVIVTFVVMCATRIGSKDPARDLAGGTVAQEQVDELREKYHLESPLVVQYIYWLGDFVTLDLGYSYAQNQPVSEMFQQRFPPTIFLGFWAITLGLLIAIPWGVYGAYKRDAWHEKASSTLSFGMLSMPPLVVAVFLLYFVATRSSFFPVDSDYVAPWSDPVGHFKNFFLPAVTIMVGTAAVWSRFLRADMVNTLQSDFIMLARAKGLSPQRILWRHALRASALSLITSVALQISALLAGAVVAEQFFAMPGIGERLVIAVQQNDLLVVQAITAVLVVFVVVINLIVDLLYAVVDPRIRHARALG